MKSSTLTMILATTALSLTAFSAQARDWLATGGEYYGDPVVISDEVAFEAPMARDTMHTERLSTNTGGETYPVIDGVFEAAAVGRVQSAMLNERQYERLYVN